MPHDEHEHDADGAPICERLAGGDPRTLRNVDAVVEQVLAEPDCVSELIACVVRSDDDIVRMRAADALEKVCRARPSLLQPHVSLILGSMSRIDQPSVTWHVAQMLGELRLTPSRRARAVQILRTNLDRSTDWIVLNCSLDTLAVLTRQDPTLVGLLREHLHQFEHSSRKSLANRARKLRAEFG